RSRAVATHSWLRDSEPGSGGSAMPRTRTRARQGLSLAAIAFLAAIPGVSIATGDEGETTFEGEVVAPPLVAQGTVFEATIVRATPKGPEPLAPGEKVSYRGKETEGG